MSPVEKNNVYLTLLLTTTNNQQAEALLETITPEQIDAISELAVHLPALKVGVKARKLLDRRRGVLSLLAKSSVSKTKKLNHIRRYRRGLLEILASIKLPLLRVLNKLKDEVEKDGSHPL